MSLLDKGMKQLNKNLSKTKIQCVEYAGETSMCRFRCNCGKEWLSLPSLALVHPYCPECLLERKREEGHDEIFENAKTKIDKQDNTVIAVYGHGKCDVVLYCEVCHNVWQVADSRFFRNGKQGCKFCKREKELNERRQRQLDVYNDLHEGELVAQTDPDNREQFIITCQRCGRTWTDSYNNVVCKNNVGKRVKCRCQQDNKATQEQLQKRLNKKHPGWEIISFIDSHEPIVARCEHGHEIENNSFVSLNARHRCPGCYQEEVAERQERREAEKYENIEKRGARGAYVDRDEIQKRIWENHPYIELVSYIDGKSPCTAICSEHDEPYEWTVSSPRILCRQGGGCPKCREEERNAKRMEQYNQALREASSPLEIIAVNGRVGRCHCCECGDEFDIALTGTSSIGQGRLICRNRTCPSRDSQKTYLSYDEAAIWVSERSEGRFSLIDFDSRYAPCGIKCETCGEVFLVKEARTFIDKPHKATCPKCNENQRKTSFEDFMGMLSSISDNIECLKYEAMSKRGRFKCKVCGEEWETEPQRIIREHTGCPRCKSTTSFPEKAICFYFDKYLNDEISLSPIIKISDFKCEGDVFIPERKILVEFDGGYWHQNTHDRDIEREKHFELADIRCIHIWESFDTKHDDISFMNEPPIIIATMSRVRSTERDRMLNNAISELLLKLDKTNTYDIDTARDRKAIIEHAKTKPFHIVYRYDARK